MAISVDWQTRVISVPRADLTINQAVPEIRLLDLDWFRLQLKSLEDNEIGITYLDTHRHIAPITVGGVELARVVEIINGYTVTFEPGAYRVDVLGGNSNLSDVLDYNEVQVVTANSAGLANVTVAGSDPIAAPAPIVVDASLVAKSITADVAGAYTGELQATAYRAERKTPINGVYNPQKIEGSVCHP